MSRFQLVLVQSILYSASTIKLALSMYQGRARARATMKDGYRLLPATLPWDEKFSNAKATRIHYVSS